MARLTRTAKYADLREQLANDKEENVASQDLSSYQNRFDNVQDTLSFNPKKEEPKPTQQELFGDTQELPSAEVKPIIQPAAVETTAKARHTQSIMFFPIPVNGVFVNGTEDIQPGESLYMLRTTDGENATFTILNTPEAIKTAIISLSETVKPVCKIINTVANPLEIVTEGPGTAIREGDTWKMVTKSVVRLI